MQRTERPIVIGDTGLAHRLLGHLLPPSWLIASIGGCVAAFHPIGQREWEGHISADLGERGATALKAYRRLLEWFWEQRPDCSSMVCVAKRENARARHFIVTLGFERELCYSHVWRDGVERETILYRKIRP